MKSLKTVQLTVLASLLMILGSSCNGGSSTKIVVVTNPNPNPTSTGPVHVCPAWGCDGPEPIETVLPNQPTICPSWGCNGPPVVIVADSVDSDTRDTDLQLSLLARKRFQISSK
jgi:hypothetical protein